MRRRLAFALAAFTVGALALPATGSAAGGGDYLRFVYFSAPASDGFRLSFTASSGPGKRQPQASFALSRRGQSVTYATKGRPAIHGNHIEGDFGPFGSFSGTFSGNVKGGKGCDPYVHHRTEFEGRLDVEGEHGFASATSASGSRSPALWSRTPTATVPSLSASRRSSSSRCCCWPARRGRPSYSPTSIDAANDPPRRRGPPSAAARC